MVANVRRIKLDQLFQVISIGLPFVGGKPRCIPPGDFENHSFEYRPCFIAQAFKVDERRDNRRLNTHSSHDRNDLIPNRCFPLGRILGVDRFVREERENQLLAVKRIDIGPWNDRLNRLDRLVDRPIVGGLIGVLAEGAEVRFRRTVELPIGHVAITGRDVLDRIVPVDHQADDRDRNE